MKYYIKQWFGYSKTLQGEGKIGVCMTPTNIDYYSNKVCMLRLQYLITSYDLPYEGPSLLKSNKTIRSTLIEEFKHHIYVSTWLGDLQRPIRATLLRYLNPKTPIIIFQYMILRYTLQCW